jgi:hypothetical protein
MAVEFLELEEGGVAMFCNTTDRFFGPKLDDLEAAEAYRRYLALQGVRNGDPRLDENERHYNAWLPEYKRVWGNWPGRYSKCASGHENCSIDAGGDCYQEDELKVGIREEIDPVCDLGHHHCSFEMGGPCEDPDYEERT